MDKKLSGLWNSLGVWGKVQQGCENHPSHNPQQARCIELGYGLLPTAVTSLDVAHPRKSESKPQSTHTQGVLAVAKVLGKQIFV